jgi:hypothetical protein
VCSLQVGGEEVQIYPAGVSGEGKKVLPEVEKVEEFQSLKKGRLFWSDSHCNCHLITVDI